jgi:hypothetical protein
MRAGLGRGWKLAILRATEAHTVSIGPDVTSETPAGEAESGPLTGTDDEAIEIYGRADYRSAARAGGLVPTAEVCRKHRASSATFSKWKAKHVGLMCPRPNGDGRTSL